jgi:hypothetical protein
MADDIVHRLRNEQTIDGTQHFLLLRAADEIERLRKELEIYKDLYAWEARQNV